FALGSNIPRPYGELVAPSAPVPKSRPALAAFINNFASPPALIMHWLGYLDSHALRAEHVGHGVCCLLGEPVRLDNRDHR
ncbi:MAG: hypothetical protein ACKPKO_11290, partial [Candidatus Fonsibacter sp.]